MMMPLNSSIADEGNHSECILRSYTQYTGNPQHSSSFHEDGTGVTLVSSVDSLESLKTSFAIQI